MKKVEEFLKSINIIPNDLKLFIQAFTHKSFTNEHKNEKNYELLEFLGDSLINFKSTYYIYQKYKNFNEGEATIKRSQIVDTNSLSLLSFELKLNELLRISKGAMEILNNKKTNADLFEALVAAIYLDQGDKVLENFLEKTLYKTINKSILEIKKDPKSEFQEILQSITKHPGEYRVQKIGEEFYAELHYDGKIFGKGKGKNKKNAEIAAAKDALSTFKKR
ncbi:ribonuclease III [Mycoplasma sp. 480]|uniref:ribonuclease III n=1 Tax=Mycoplasma sp. 480 TaxID=3440155 RepID=UPI003F5122CB